VSGRASDTAYAGIKQRIVSGAIPPNALIDEQEIAEELGVSRTPVREALLRLEAERLVEIGRGKGIRVLSLSSADMRAIYQVITGLEATAVFLLTARKPSRGELGPLLRAVDDFEVAAAAGDDGAWGDADERFHRALLELSGNERLTEAGCRQRDAAQRAHLVAVRLQSAEYKARSAENHRGLIDLILAGDPWAAHAAHFRQRMRGEDALVSIVERFNLQNL
jgi:DNA-binding GntR family transcriptional regulator